MAKQARQWEPILPYPSRESVIDLVVALIERRFDLATPQDWKEDESYYLYKGDATQFSEFRASVDWAIRGAEPTNRLLRELKDFERMIAELAIESLQNTQEGQAILEAMQAIAVYRHKQEGQSHNDQ
jgi:hypothetical protein